MPRGKKQSEGITFTVTPVENGAIIEVGGKRFIANTITEYGNIITTALTVKPKVRRKRTVKAKAEVPTAEAAKEAAPKKRGRKKKYTAHVSPAPEAAKAG